MRHGTQTHDKEASTEEGDASTRRFTEKDQPPGRVVVVDDLPSNIVLLTQQLTRDGYIVHSAANGEEALELIAREQPDVVLMDVMMPRRDGFDTCRALKQSA